MDLTTAVNSLGSDYVNKVSDLLTNKTNTASGTTDDSSFDSVFMLFRDYWIVPIHIFSRHSRRKLIMHLVI